MKKSLFLLLISTVSVYTMDYQEDVISKETKLQIYISNKSTTEDTFQKIIAEHPALQDLTVIGHAMEQIPILYTNNRPHHYNLITIDLSNGLLADSSTLSRLLETCPQLQTCILVNNKLANLSEDLISQHTLLHTLDCSNNQITTVDFTKLRKKLPNLHTLKLSECPLNTFKTDKYQADSIITIVHLNNTTLPDPEKKEILKNAFRTCIIDVETNNKNKGKPFSTISGLLAAGFLLPSVWLIIATIPSFPSAFALSSGSFMVSLPLGTGLTYFGFLGCTLPENRFKSAYIPLMDKTTENYSEEEVTTFYARFVRHFPYVGNILKCCKAEDPESIPLNQI